MIVLIPQSLMNRQIMGFKEGLKYVLEKMSSGWKMFGSIDVENEPIFRIEYTSWHIQKQMERVDLPGIYYVDLISPELSKELLEEFDRNTGTAAGQDYLVEGVIQIGRTANGLFISFTSDSVEKSVSGLFESMGSGEVEPIKTTKELLSKADPQRTKLFVKPEEGVEDE